MTATPGNPEGPAELESARAELRRLGYLDHGLERFLLQDALRPRQPLRTLALLTAKVGLLGGSLLAAALAVALAMANGSVAAAPLDLPVLFLHLFPLFSLTAALAFLMLGSAVLLVLHVYPVRRIEAVALATSLVAGVAALGLAFWEARHSLAESGAGQRAAVALGAAAAGYGLVRLAYQGLLALAIRFTRRAPAEGLVAWRWRRWVSGVLAAGALLLAVPVVLAARDGGVPPSPLLPMAPGERVLVLGLDGVLPEEVDYLLRRGELPAVAALAGAQGQLLRYARPDEPPAALWTRLATGLAPAQHGVAALDSFLPLGVRTPLARSGFLRSYWSAIEVPLHLAEYRPVLSNRRNAFALWELASRGGAPILAINWWATFPAPRVAGLVLSHDAYQLLRQGVAGAVSAPQEAAALRRSAQDMAAAPAGGATGPSPAADSERDDGEAVLNAALAPGDAAAVAERALRPDAFYRRTFADRLAVEGSPPPRAAALYLPGLDIAAAGWRGGDLAFADLLRRQLHAADGLLAQALAQPGWGAVVVVFDPGRRRRPLFEPSPSAAPADGPADNPSLGRAATENTARAAASDAPRVAGLLPSSGRLLLWQRRGCSPGASITTLEAVTAGLLRTLGLPQSAELPSPPPQCRWPDPPATVATYGHPQPPTGGLATAEGAEYLQNLRSLGYL